MDINLKTLSIQEAKKHYWGCLLIYRNELLNLMSRIFKERGSIKILEIGCFKGMLYGWLSSAFPREKYSYEYIGIDIVEPPDRVKGYTHLVMNAEALEFPPNTFDVILMVEVLEHIIDYVKALYEVYRVLKSGGYLFIQSVICYDKCALVDQSHFHVLHPVTLNRLLNFIGFKILEYKEGGNFYIIAQK